ncbi:V-set and transmembrane domain-containing protein 4 isoform X2 [Hyla sarda]|uniref:V-set and transmembrane domain-containing protein 4 isoform X2 n=1 Tax=Hyla sarda TaxID=327740 RepID=UPI0024C39052|nr:V-set and transmembrane domain-containing protein 4 isoform X2 [Hyla sarda]XP_056387226.1 V-set and transmembrane domain-containing protein 4 isoform X2 [Hyla sarda]
MAYCLVASAFLSQVLIASLSYTLNVTVSPSPWALHHTGENASIWCLVSQKKKQNSLLTVRWVYSPKLKNEQTIGRITKHGNMQISSNWSQKGDIENESPGRGYRLLLIDLHPSDQGTYICRVQEVAWHRGRWSAVSNGTATTYLKVTTFAAFEEKQIFTWALFQDLYLYAVLICCVGIFSLLTFLLILLCQAIFKGTHSKVKWECSERAFDGDPFVTNLLSSGPPKKKKMKKKPEEIPPAIPVKGPLISLEGNSRQALLLPKLVEEGLTYAELELIKPKPPIIESSSGTVYAQILFENQEKYQEGKNPCVQNKQIFKEKPFKSEI